MIQDGHHVDSDPEREETVPAAGRILIVDDSEANVVYVSQILQHYGYDYHVARSGAEALRIMSETPPSLVLLDLMMPETSGVGVFKQMKEDPRLRNIPVLIVSGASMITGVDVRTGEQRPNTSYKDEFSLGFGTLVSESLQGLEPDGFIDKPIHPPTLVARIKELLA